MLLLRICLILFTSICVESSNLDILTNNFFENLQAHPLLAGKSLNKASKSFIDSQITNYLNLVTRETKTTKKKRSLLDKYTKEDKGIFLFDGVEQQATIPVRFPEDIAIFELNSLWYAAALESPSAKEKANYLVIFTYENDSFTETTRIPVVNGVKLATINLENSIVLAVAEYDSPKAEFHNKSGIFHFDGSTITKIQSIDMHFAGDVSFWKIHDDIFLSIVQFKRNENEFEIETPIYKWLGKHFNFVQNISTKGAKKITPFEINNEFFLAVANFRNNRGKTQIYSEIHKYDFHTEKYDLHQRILTKACTDIEVFQLEVDFQKKDTFLIVANSYEDTDEDKDYETDSIIYKLIDDYFVPLQSLPTNGIQQWLAIQKNEFLLLGSYRFEGLKAFQYDGWSFREIQQNFPKVLQNELKSVRFANLKNSSIVVANKNNNGKKPNLFSLKFTHQKILDNIYNEMLNWCDQGLKKVQDLTQEPIFESILGKTERGDVEEDPERFEEIKEMDSKIDSLSSLINDLQIEIPHEISAKELIFNGDVVLENLNATILNNISPEEFLDNVLDINQGFSLDEISINSILTNNTNLQNINGHNSNNLLHVYDDLDLDLLEINGTLEVPEIQLKGTLNGITINNQTLLQKLGDQKFEKTLQLNRLEVKNLKLKTLNGEDISAISQVGNSPSKNLEKLVVKNLTIGGYINDVDIPTLEKFSLKKFGDQVITSEFLFDVIEGKNLEVFGMISNRNLSNLIGIDSGDYTLNQTLLFNDIFVNDLIVTQNLDEIEIKNGKLDILLKNHPEEQEISGDKIFDNVTIHHAISLQGHINSKNLEKMNPVVSINDRIFLEGDKTITGRVEIENFVNVNDIVTPNGYSLKKLESEGLRLNSTQINPHLVFVQQLNLDEIIVDKINDLNPNSFVVVDDNEETQIIVGVKTFLGDLRIEGDTNAIKINNVDVEELENNIMKTEGDQTISGKHTIRHVIANKIISNETVYDSNLSVVSSLKSNLTVDEKIKTQTVKAGTIFVRGRVNDLDLAEIFNDTVTTTTIETIRGHKYFKKLSVNDVTIEEGFKVDQIPDEIDEFTLNEAVSFNSISIRNLQFEKECNGVPQKNFGESTKSEIDTNHEFESITVYGNTFITSNKINDIDIETLALNSVKIDEPHEFKHAIFEDEIVASKVNLDGQIENLDLDNAVLSEQNLEIFDMKIFKNLTINGSVTFEQLVNGINMTQFCEFAMEEHPQKNLILDNAIFAKGPNVKTINGIETSYIKNQAWFSDEDVRIEGACDFADLHFKEDIQVEGFVDNISLSLLYENYFSKTKPQNITATLTFTNSLIFEKDFHVLNVSLNNGKVNDISLERFIRTVLLDDYDQVFENPVFFENCTVETLSGEFTVNGFDLEKDVMRYDKVNMVTGAKRFDSLNIQFLKLDKNIKIQDVDILEWFKNSVLKTTGFNITGTKSFKSGIFSRGLQVAGLLNGQKFDTDNVLVRNIPQEISGTKTIKTKPQNPVKFKALKLKGLLNGVDLSELINNQAYKNRDNIFKTRINLYNNITANNLVIKKTYQGVNVTDLMQNVTNLGILNNLVQQYQTLLEMSQTLQKSLRGQAYFLHQYKIIQTIYHATNSRKVLCPDGISKIGILVENPSGTSMNLYGWNQELFQFSLNATMHFRKHLKLVEQVFMGRYLYAEQLDSTGTFIRMTDFLETQPTEYTNLTISTTSFKTPNNEVCTLFVYQNNLPNIFCEDENGIKLKQTLSPKAIQATSLTIDASLYLIVLTQPTLEMEAYTNIYKLNRNSQFELYQALFEAHPRSLSTIFYKNFYYLAIASGHLKNVMYSGRVEIYKFDSTSLQFIPWQSLKLDAPMQVDFAILPSGELILYVLTDNPTEPLLVFRYEGIAGFQLKITGSVLPQITSINQFKGATGQHFIVAQSYDEINVIQAVFKGEKDN